MIQLVSYFKGISNFVVYLMPKPSLLKNLSSTIQLIVGGGSYISFVMYKENI